MHHGILGRRGRRYLLALLVLRVSLDLAYTLFVAPSFFNHFLTPMRFEFTWPNYLISYFLFGIGAITASHRDSRVSNLFFLIAIAFVFAPLTTMYGLDAGRTPGPVILTLLSLGIVRLVTVVGVGWRVRLPFVASGDKLILLVSVLAVALVLGWSVASGAAASVNFDISQIYLYRDKLSRMTDVGVMAYVNVWAHKVFNVVLFTVALTKRRYGLAAIALAVQVYFFGVTAQRIVLFLPVLSVGVWYFYSTRMGLARLTLAIASALVLILGISVYYDAFELGSIAIRRAFFVPASLTYEWFEYFAVHDHVYWSDRILSGLLTTGYTGERVPSMIGAYFAPLRGEVAMNNGLVSAGYAHAGYAGILLYSVVFGLFCRLCDRLVRSGVDIVIVAAVLVGPVRTTWADSDLPTAFLTHGLAIGLATLWVYGRTRAFRDRPVR